MSNSSIVISSILFKAYKQGTYFLFPSITSIKSSAVALQRNTKSAFIIRYSCKIYLIKSSSSSQSTCLEIEIPPFCFYLNSILGGCLFNLIPNPSNSFSIILLCFKGLVASSTIIIKLQVLATAMTYFPLPFPSLAPSMIPGKSNSWILAPLYLITPGTQVRVVNS
jgi:hypothetical protein